MGEQHTMKLFALTLGCILSHSALLAAPARPAAKAAAKPRAAVLLVQGRVKAAAKPPRPGSVPYKDAVIAVRLVDAKALKGKLGAREILVYTWGMRDRKHTRAAKLKPGQTVKMKLSPWERAERKYGSYNRFEVANAFALDAYWGEPA
jgi:hypothetical protein